jgi:hypothetical protein
MLGLDEIRRSLTAAWRLFLDRPDAMRAFDLSVDGFWRSFGAIVLILPAYILISTAEKARILTDGFTGVPFSESAFIAHKTLSLALDWVTLPLVMALIVGPLGLTRSYAAFVVARNWGAALAIQPFGVIALLFLLGFVTADAANIFSLLMLIVVIRFNYLIARRALEAPIGLAVAVVVGDLALSLLIVGFADSIFPYGAPPP